MSYALQIALAFGSMFIVDLINAIYIKHIQRDNALLTAGTSVLIFLVYSVAIIGYVEDHWLLVPACCGAFAGSALGVQINKRWVSR